MESDALDAICINFPILNFISRKIEFGVLPEIAKAVDEMEWT